MEFHNGGSSIGSQLIMTVAMATLIARIPQPATAQAPVGNIEGVVTDSTSAQFGIKVSF